MSEDTRMSFERLGYVTTHLRKSGAAACGTRTDSWRLVDDRPTCKKCRDIIRDLPIRKEDE